MNKQLIKLIKLYQVISNKYLSKRCRFEPTCSQFTINQLQSKPLFAALLKSSQRLLSCHPWHNEKKELTK